MSVATCSANETDLYRFAVTPGTCLLRRAAADRGRRAFWRLVDPYGNSLFSQGFSSTPL